MLSGPSGRFFIVSRSGAIAINPSAASWSATLRIHEDSPKISWTTSTTGALLLLSGYTTHVRRLSPLPVRTVTHSPCRGELLSRASAPEASGGNPRLSGALTLEAEDG